MEHLRTFRLLDERGNPLSGRIETVLTRLLPRLQRQFPALQDEVALTEVLEEAGRRIANREQRAGPIEKLHGYAWVTLRSVATSWMRRGSSRLVGKTLAHDESRAALSVVPAESGTPKQIERDILLREALAQLTPEERFVCLWKKEGYSSQEIARHCRSSVAAVDTLFSRTKQKMRRLLSVQDVGAPRQKPTASTGRNLQEPSTPDERAVETLDDESTPAARSGL
jgi:RNA polymerase sigma factor (sigma-70 family)